MTPAVARISCASLLTAARAEQQMFGGDVFILQPIGFFLGLGENIVGGAVHPQLRAGGVGQAIEFGR